MWPMATADRSIADWLGGEVDAAWPGGSAGGPLMPLLPASPPAFHDPAAVQHSLSEPTPSHSPFLSQFFSSLSIPPTFSLRVCEERGEEAKTTGELES